MNEAPKVTGNSTLPQGNNPVSGANTAGANPKAQAIKQGVDTLDKISDKLDGSDKNPTPQLGEQVATGNSQIDENGNEVPGYKPGDKVAPGYEVGEDGKVKQSATSRLQSAVAGGAAAYFSGGNTEAMDAARRVSDSKIGRKISDTVEKTPLKNVAEAAEKNGTLDTAEGAMDVVTAAKNMDAKGVAEGAKKVKEGTKKQRKQFIIISAVCSTLIVGLPLFLIFLVAISAATGINDENGTSSAQIYENTYNYDWEGEDNEGDNNDNDDNDDPKGNGNENITGDPILLNIPYYNQGNYASKKFGGKNIATSGCSVTSLAMVFSYLKGQSISPPDVVDKIASVKGNYNYYYAGKKGQSWDIMTEVPSFYGVSVNQIALASVKNALADGKPVIASVGCCTFTRHGHFIVIKGYDPVNGVYYVNDPNHSSFLSKSFPESIFKNEAKAFWSFG